MRKEKSKKQYIILFVLVVASLNNACDYKTHEAVANQNEATRLESLENMTLDGFQKDLLEVAIETASAIPVHPHIKTRSKAQEAVVAACLELNQPQRALEYMDQIENWRRGSCYADLAVYCIQQGQTGEVEKYLDIAEKITQSTDTQEWRNDSIKVRIAKARHLLGQTEKAEQLTANLVESESGKLAGIKASTIDEKSFDDQMKAIDALIAPGVFDVQKNALEACTELYNRFYGNPELRNKVEDKIKTSWEHLPIFIRIDLILKLSAFALDHSDPDKALELANEAQAIMDNHEWPLEEHLTYGAKIIKMRARAGDREIARTGAEGLRTLYAEKGKGIVNIWRGGVLRPLAEAYQSIGDTETAILLYKQAVEEGVENPNSRPRAEDLSATCVSMALSYVEPDAELWKRIREIQKGLGDPW